MQKNKSTHQDNNKEEDKRTTKSERTIFLNTFFLHLHLHYISFFYLTFNMNGTFNKKQTNRATHLQRTNAGYGVKKQLGKETQNILSTKLYDRSINKYRLKPNQEGKLAVLL
jgi:hypothetical protein